MLKSFVQLKDYCLITFYIFIIVNCIIYDFWLPRISDSNARLASNTINLVELISKAMGSSFKNYIKGYLPGVLNALGDPKVFDYLFYKTNTVLLMY